MNLVEKLISIMNPSGTFIGFDLPGGRFELPIFMYEITILPLNYPGIFIIMIRFSIYWIEPF